MISSAPAHDERVETHCVVASRLLDTIPPRYAAHNISERSRAHFSPAGGQEQKEKDLRAISPVFPSCGLCLRQYRAWRFSPRIAAKGRPIDRRRRAHRAESSPAKNRVPGEMNEVMSPVINCNAAPLSHVLIHARPLAPTTLRFRVRREINQPTQYRHAS